MTELKPQRAVLATPSKFNPRAFSMVAGAMVAVGIGVVTYSFAGTNPYDLNRDGRVNAADLSIVEVHYNQPVKNCPRCDVNRDGSINVFDALLIEHNYTK